MGELSNVFLLSGIGAMLAVMTNRLSRIMGLLWFLREIFVATRNLRIASRHVHGGRAAR